ncbi:DUF2336 domain-containing protein [Parvularcula sp. ZS-1/3]|uniref:DUF2336 domain-containing protein n=1 Tax=Parvularcula mediterranea TaxID=2732508 RepID=A0A7Y3RKH2_9PROT|nr:DUF2336 domain-containing protein [Parvularcula mediterranea]NNU15221.1 DUF2336 domain-containing protein [Parvularcula mediterranea]
MMEQGNNQSGSVLTDDQMLQAISDLLVSTRAYQNRSDRAYADELVGRIVESMSEEGKVKAASFLARLSSPPEELLRELTLSSTEAAKEILSARYVSDAILMESASKGPELREIIARRPQLSEPVVNKLLFHEEAAVEGLLLSRPEIQLSNSRAARLISRADRESTLGYLLSTRNDITPRLSLRLFWQVNTDSRKAILRKFNADPKFAAEIFTKMLASGAQPAKHDSVGSLARLIAGVLKADSGDGRVSIEAEELRQFRAKPHTAIIQSIAGKANISAELARKISDDYDGDSFAILCRAAGVSEKTFAKLAAAKPPKPVGHAPMDADNRERLKAVFTMLNASAAIAILSYWEIDIVEQDKAEKRRRLAMDLKAMEERLTAEFGEERKDLMAAGEQPRKKVLGVF